MNSKYIRILAVDDHATDLRDLAVAFPGSVEACLVDLSRDDVGVAVDQALALLRSVRPDIIVLDLKWNDQSSYLDGFRFLRCACQGNLLTGAKVVVWSGFLREAGPAIAKLSTPLRLAGVKSFTTFDKPGLPVLEAV
jgi:DNA-binding NarL/FixJ family response regulator